MNSTWQRRAYSAVALLLVLMGTAACAAPQDIAQRDDGIVDIVATTPILHDVIAQVAGERARVSGLMPPGADPHSYEPGLRDVRTVANADLVFANHLLLEPEAVMDTVRESTRAGVEVVAVSEAAESYGARLIPLVEDVTLDTPWLGARVTGTVAGAPYLDLVATALQGPGELAAFVTGAFGQPITQFNSADGLDQQDRIRLPADAHTHMSWSFTAPGHYRLQLAAIAGEREIARGEINFAVGIDPGAGALRAGHFDLAVDTRTATLGVLSDENRFHHTNVEVPNRTLQRVPADPAYRFMGRPGAEVYLLPQAVLGKHIHGEIDPHTWHDVGNVAAFVRLIRDRLSELDPAGRSAYHSNAAAYLEELEHLDQWLQRTLAEIPPHRRHLVTTHDGYGYLAAAYGLDIAGFVSPNPAIEPSPRDLIALDRTLRGLKVPAVFLEPREATRPGTLTQIAHDQGIRICQIHGDAFTEDIDSYIDLMTANAVEIKDCLS